MFCPRNGTHKEFQKTRRSGATSVANSRLTTKNCALTLDHAVMDSSRLIVVARLRDRTVRAERIERLEIRKRLLANRPKHRTYGESDDKLRAVICAIRTHTNSDAYLSADMTAAALYRHTLRALSGHSAATGASESKLMGEALVCIDRLNYLLSRC